MPFAKIRSARSRISSLVTVLLITRRRRSDPVSGAMVMPCSPLALEHPHDRLRQIVEPQRRGADRVAHLDGARENPIDVRMVAERDGHEPDAVGVHARGLGELENAVGRKRADGQVVVAGPAEAAQVRAAADDFDEEARSELGVGREDAGRRRVERVGVLTAALCTGNGASAPLGSPITMPASVPGARIAARRTTARKSRARARGSAGGRGRSRGLPHETRSRTGTRISPSPAAITSANRRERFGIHERHRAADHDQRMARRAFGGVARNAGQAEQRQHVHVVPLEGDGERDDVEVADRRLRFEGQQRRVRGEQLGELLLGRQKHALADGTRP